MRQPDLGNKVAELRNALGYTQEKLAEYCEVSTRTIQRIESGEVEPRAFTRNSLSNILEYDLSQSEERNENLWLVIMHLSCIFSNLIIPLIIWSWKKDHSYRVNRHGRDVINFQITILLMLFAALLLFLLSIPILIFTEGVVASGDFDRQAVILIFCSLIPMILIGIFTTYQGVVNAIRVLTDKPYRYPLSIPFIK